MSVVLLAACHSESIEIVDQCRYNAVMKDHSDLDGCGFLLRLESGKYLEPLWSYFLQTPAQPIEDPMQDLELVDGMHVQVDFEYVESFATGCMGGSLVMINSIKEAQCAQAE
ncbi:hypothetical protein JMN32_20900 [Fulvivirga sp. 29W222]|uniref:Uncharacterized protein n=1 Tax=Fulvivirga marina TaxID=2494733 RepID=A0A937FZB9_9BACT|nr:hypothetical protein [Fulvivirga marina]MBL6448784.1 hypothetical protein [Fulvivirga marina]